jgi:hypothetical protein
MVRRYGQTPSSNQKLAASTTKSIRALDVIFSCIFTLKVQATSGGRGYNFGNNHPKNIHK